MQYTAKQALALLQNYQESERLEAKLGHEIGASVMQSVCAFANEPHLNGGYLLLGVAEADESHDNFWVAGVENSDKLLNDLQTNCRDQFEYPIKITAQKEKINGKMVILVYVHELDVSAKPCAFKGKLDSKNKRKTGVWRRGVNGDYECSQTDLEPLLLAKMGTSFETHFLQGSSWEDLDLNAIERYRHLRERVNPEAPELLENNQEMLVALNVVDRQKAYQPNVAGLLLFGKATALRRLLPEMRVDYVRLSGQDWSQDEFIETLDLREPLLYTIPKLESKILSDMPHHFRLEPNQLQRSDTPLLPQKAVRESVVNALMHRDYLVKEPIIVARFADRLEIQNAGFSLKPEKELGQKGSRLRNPVLAAVLYDVKYAETKGSGIGIIKEQLRKAQLIPPTFHSDILANSFKITCSFNQLLDEQQLAWLSQFKAFNLSQDAVMALVLAKENGSVNHQSLKALSKLESHQLSKILADLVKFGLLVKQGSGRGVVYFLSQFAKDAIPTRESVELNSNSGKLNAENVELNQPNNVELAQNSVELTANNVELNGDSGKLNEESTKLNDKNSVELPASLQSKIEALSQKPAKEVLSHILVEICTVSPMNIQQLATLLKRKDRSLRPILNQLVKQGDLVYLYPDTPTHPAQGYIANLATKEKGN